MHIPLPVVLFFVWLAGYCLSYVMLRAEQTTDGEPYTFGDRALILATSLISWLMVFIMLIRAWVTQVGIKGYWERPVTPPATVLKATLVNEQPDQNNKARVKR